MARWGLIPFWMKEKPKVPHINARAETVDKHLARVRINRQPNADVDVSPNVRYRG
jgi:putative SOS response-associated peptidase YedK